MAPTLRQRRGVGQLGGTTYVSSPYAKLSKATTGAFATVSTGGTDAPKAAVLCTNLGFLIAGNYDNGTAYPDGVYWSALNAPDDWRPDVATQCGYVSLRNFIDLIGMVGSFAVGALSILILLAYLRARRMRLRTPELRVRIPTLVTVLVILVLIAGVVIEFLHR